MKLLAVLLLCSSLSAETCNIDLMKLVSSPQKEDRTSVPGKLPGVVHIMTVRGRCTGWVVGKNKVVTAAHCVLGLGNDPEVTVEFQSGATAAFHAVYTNEETDVAVLRGDTGKYRPFKVARNPKIPELCLVITLRGGHQLILPCVAQKLTRDLLPKRLALRAEVLTGDSGSPVIGRRNEVIGMITQHSTEHQYGAYSAVLSAIHTGLQSK